jgi:predicted DNA binding CopG/RHH family protein
MKYKLDDDEIELLNSIEKGEWKSIDNSNEEIMKYQDYARQHINKDKRVNIRITSRDLDLLKLKAVQEGLPYQTFISSILHKYLNNYL